MELLERVYFWKAQNYFCVCKYPLQFNTTVKENFAMAMKRFVEASGKKSRYGYV